MTEIERPARAERDRMPRWVPRAILLFLGGIVMLAVLSWTFTRLRSLLVMLLVSLFLSFAIEPAVNRLAARGWRRGTATMSVFVLILAAVALFIVAMGSLVTDQVTKLVDETPGYITEIETWLNDQFDIEIETDQLLAEFSEGGAAASLASNIAGNLVSIGTTVVSILFQMLTISLFTFYLVADGPRLRRLICSTLSPGTQTEVLRIWELAIDKTGAYIYSRALLALSSFICHWIAFAMLDVPFPVPLAIWVGVLSQFVPVVGTYFAGVLPVLIALLDQPLSAVWVLIIILVYQQLENYLLQPRVTAHTMAIHPAVAFGTVIVGASLLGTVGALLAIPAGATVQAFVSTYVTRHELVDSALLGDSAQGVESAEAEGLEGLELGSSDGGNEPGQHGDHDGQDRGSDQ
ncbi:MAG: AI-2E family transporter [Actinomycetota bacterium]|jgi:predicted PurR-regulated permease PerM|nr:AI-2E family transporter [Actinomycetota bacterium]